MILSQCSTPPTRCSKYQLFGRRNWLDHTAKCKRKLVRRGIVMWCYSRTFDWNLKISMPCVEENEPSDQYLYSRTSSDVLAVRRKCDKPATISTAAPALPPFPNKWVYIYQLFFKHWKSMEVFDVSVFFGFNWIRFLDIIACYVCFYFNLVFKLFSFIHYQTTIQHYSFCVSTHQWPPRNYELFLGAFNPHIPSKFLSDQQYDTYVVS